MEIIIAVSTGLVVFLIILLIATAISSENVTLIQKEKVTVNNLCDKVFKSDLEIVAHKMGIATDKYIFNCNVLGIKPKIALVIFTRIIAILIFVIGMAMTLVISNTYAKIFIGLISVAVTAIVFIAPTSTVSGKAEKKKEEFESEIPRFLDLLQTALKINLPIATAIKITAESVDGILSEELLKALTVTEVGTSNWQDALYDIAQKYEVDSFSDFVLDIVTAYQKGSDITKSVERQSRDLKTTTLLKAKENASKATSTVLLPVVIFKMLPLMAILFLPVILQLVKAF